jgi:hypothetical protein
MLISVLLSGIVLPAHAYSVRGIGGIPCSMFNNGNAKWWEPKIQWVWGYITGVDSVLNAAITAGSLEVSNDKLIELVDKYCKGHPTDTLSHATNTIGHMVLMEKKP